MIKRFLLLVGILLAARSIVEADSEVVYQDITLEQALDLGLPVMWIETENGEEPTCHFVQSPYSDWRKGTVADNKVPSSMILYNADGSERYSSGSYKKGESGLTMKIRGNGSATYLQKSYKLKLQKKADLLGRDSEFKDKNWALINPRMMREIHGLQIASLFGESWTPASECMNVVVNGKFRGMYLLSETIERNEECRINVDKQGFVAEHDPYWWLEEKYVEGTDSPDFGYSFKYPDPEDIDQPRMENIRLALQRFDEDKANATFNVIDSISFARWYLIHNVLGQFDGGGTNLYLCSMNGNPDEKLSCGPVWDLECIENSEELSADWSNAGNRLGSELFHSDPIMRNMDSIWQAVRERVIESLDTYYADAAAGNFDAIERSYQASFEIYGEFYTTLNQHIATLKTWYETRIPWLDQKFFEYRTSGINGTASDRPAYTLHGLDLGIDPDVAIYSIDGTEIANPGTGDVTLPGTGIYILRQNGKSVKIATH